MKRTLGDHPLAAAPAKRAGPAPEPPAGAAGRCRQARVLVRSLGGEDVADVPLSQVATVRDVKRVVFNVAGVPVMNQRVLEVVSG
ncbi:unnamed protein product [Prorocentrum cordatum]|uniref:Ubiquitin-like domain-containing protein n=1 Tax=Prorocentrum cordatum TaxID=2364126 RepID=A0ABN9Q431_9DINO|nr:unnamed protein product [Polarella glacialis]